MELEELLKSYDLTKEEINDITRVINHIFIHPEFQKRLTNSFLHHGKTTLGKHILDDVVLTYKLSLLVKKDNYNPALALKIAMFHDLYTEPWQNNEQAKFKKFSNKHGFRHPIESTINACSWFLSDFDNMDETKIIIDGIIHHMFPLPVVVINKEINNRELNNYDLFKELPSRIQDIIINSTKRKIFFGLSWSKSKYLEGKIVSKADKRASLRQFNNISGVIALVTGHNKSIRK